MTAVDAGSAESEVMYETQQHGAPSLRSARGEPTRDTHHTHIITKVLYAKKKGIERERGKILPVLSSPFRLRCIAWSTATLAGKDSSMLISVCCTDVMSGVVMGDLFLCLLCDFLGVVGKGAAASTSSDESSP